MKKLTINFQPKSTSGKTTSINAFINYGYTNYFEQSIKNEVQRGMTFMEAWQQAANQSTVNFRFERGDEKLKYIPIKVSTGISLPTAFWDNENKIATGNYTYVNVALNLFKSNVETLYNHLLTKLEHHQLTPDNFKEEIKKTCTIKDSSVISPVPGSSVSQPNSNPLSVVHSDQIGGKISFVEFSSQCIAEEKVLSKNKLINLKNVSITQYESFVAIFKKYEEDRNRIVYCTDIDDSLLKDFFLWLQTDSPYAKQNKKGYTADSLNNKKKAFKKYFQKAIDKFKLNFVIPKRKGLLSKVQVDRKDIVYLTVFELDKLQKVDLSVLPDRAETVLNYFIVSCFSGGARYSDYAKMKLNQIDKDSYAIEYKSSKTGKVVKVPAFKRVIAIYRKYNGNLPKLPNNTDFNDTLKMIIRAAKLNDKSKADKISSHSARKSFCSNMLYHYQWSVPEVMLCSGHDTMSEFQKYVGNDINENYLRLNKRLKAINE